ncbi:hypothetical protein M9H77_03533 [Catharanthus roseus]|uniref:Uncharacterized protein n=1 Tax=Catharanthus roseus TaxID=4058 RepID=A0ACC0CBN7_CATRO|nr:hypothetical protein M9H77_03533 [Catharanthus roseus]
MVKSKEFIKGEMIIDVIEYATTQDSCFCLFSVNSSITTAVSHHCWLTTYLKKKPKSGFQNSHRILIKSCYLVPSSGFRNRLRFYVNVTGLITRATGEKFNLSGVWCMFHSTSDADVIRNFPSCFSDSRELLSSLNLAQANWHSVHTFSLLSPCSLIPVMSWTEPHDPNRISLYLIQDAGQAWLILVSVLFSVSSSVTAAISHHYWLTTYLKKKLKSIFQTSHPILKSFD